MANNTYIGGEIKLIGGLSDLFAIDSKIVRYTKADNNGEVSVQEIIDELLRRISVLEGSKNNVASIELSSSVSNIVYSKNISPFTITAEVKPDTALNKEITWTSSSEANLTVNEGLVNFISAVTPYNVEDSIIVTITATSKQNPDISASCDITVTKANNSITIKRGNTNITGQTIDVTLIDEIELTAVDSSKTSPISWVSDREDILTIKNGIVQFGNQYKTGDVKITASVPNSDNYKKAESQTTLTVSKATDEIYFELDGKKVTQINKTISTTDTNNSFTLKVTSKSGNIINEFASSKSNVATVKNNNDGTYTVKMLKWYNSEIRLTADTLDNNDKRYLTKEQSINLKVNPIGQTLKASENSLTWGGFDELNSKEITIEGCQTSLIATPSNDITATVSGSKVTIKPTKRNISGTVTIKAEASDIYSEGSVTVNVTVQSQSVKYYWYLGWDNEDWYGNTDLVTSTNGWNETTTNTMPTTYNKTTGEPYSLKGTQADTYLVLIIPENWPVPTLYTSGKDATYGMGIEDAKSITIDSVKYKLYGSYGTTGDPKCYID